MAVSVSRISSCPKRSLDYALDIEVDRETLYTWRTSSQLSPDFLRRYSKTQDARVIMKLLYPRSLPKLAGFPFDGDPGMGWAERWKDVRGALRNLPRAFRLVWEA